MHDTHLSCDVSDAAGGGREGKRNKKEKEKEKNRLCS